ncbi:MAG: nitroreductase family deazaflavin-dependent oxidoreductase [Pseudomonadales bacterium]
MSKKQQDISPVSEKIGKVFLRWYSKSNTFLYRLTGGRVGGKFMGKAPVCLVTMLGKKSGQWRTTPLIHIPHGDGIILVASQGGMSKNPIWYNNLVAHDEITVTVGYSKTKMKARQVSDEEKTDLWPIICAVHPGFDGYQERTDRNIPVMLCTPV